ncbi:UPF0175 family protein [Candidatus Parabeggiatoa sp. HSG14]|uniref:UPF0175 family protein n=1 Tax=Candidatus Parabeggiatoa sp. HSG14 TaxID=3055593 RepID=UPI0025A6DF6B|nr:UPF0175 family protein [Thiotrichales bacterium HSG14]
MINTISIECPVELLLSLRINIEDFGELMKIQSAISLFKEGKISSGMAAQWLNIPRVLFLFKAKSSVGWVEASLKPTTIH